MSVITLTGWGQPHDALRDIAPDAHHFDYTAHDTVEGVFSLLAQQARDARAVIGWSMGGQIAVRAVAQGIIAPAKLVLIATPYRFMKQGAESIGMDPLTYTQFRDNLQMNAQRTLTKSYALIAHGDAQQEAVKPRLADARARLPERDWLYWYDMLGQYDCDALDLSRFPPTLLVHGDRDAVVGEAQSRRFAGRIPGVRLELFAGCGHAPHWHDTPRLMRILQDFMA